MLMFKDPYSSNATLTILCSATICLILKHENCKMLTDFKSINLLNAIYKILGCFKYLGIPVGSKPIQRAFWTSLIDNINQK